MTAAMDLAMPFHLPAQRYPSTGWCVDSGVVGSSSYLRHLQAGLSNTAVPGATVRIEGREGLRVWVHLYVPNLITRRL